MLNLLDQTLRLIYPHLCVCCEERSIPRQQLLCIPCSADMPFTDHFESAENKVMEHFYGRASIRYGAALLYFGKNTSVQRLLYRFKYEGQRDIGIRLGQHLGRKLAASPFFQETDLILPFPIHAEKRKRRGFNQTEILAKAVLEHFPRTYRHDVLVKILDTDSQTFKSRAERQVNVENALGIRNENLVRSKHVLLIDDVITTGATAEAAVRILKKCGAASVSLVTAGAAVGNFL